MKITLPNGTTIEGSPEELARLGNAAPARAPVYVPFPLPATAPGYSGWWGIYPPVLSDPYRITCEVRS